jgi:hypothetical protein
MTHRIFIAFLLMTLILTGAGVLHADDLPSKEHLGSGYVRRGEEIHFLGAGGTASNTRIDRPSDADAKGFGQSLQRTLRPCRSVHAPSFVPLSEEYSHDDNMVFYKWISLGRFLLVELAEADVASFKVVNFAHATDVNSIWYEDRPIVGSDPATAELIDNRIIKDAGRVYVSGVPQPHLDAPTFRHVGSGYFLDANGVFWGSEPVHGADPASFKVLGDSFVAADARNVYRSGQIQPHLDAETIRLIVHNPYGYQVVSDRNGVYVNNLRFLHADPKDFTMVGPRTGRGGAHIFLVDRDYNTPVTLFRENEQLVVETIMYATGTVHEIAIVKAVVGKDALHNVTVLPPPGKLKAGAVPPWQIEILKRPDMIERMNTEGAALDDHLKG